MKKSKKPDYLTLCSIAAQEAGMSYGKYMALHGYNPPIIRREPDDNEDDNAICPECGKPFHKTDKCRVYCSFDCYSAYSRKRANRRYHEKRAAMIAQKEEENELEIRSH